MMENASYEYEFANNYFVGDENLVISSNQMKEIYINESTTEIPDFINEDVVELEILGKGGFSTVKKAYHKRMQCFIALKFFHQKKSKVEQILLEDFFLRKVEQIAEIQNNHEHFLKYYKLSKNQKNTLILQMENGLGTLDDVLKGGKIYKCEEVLFALNSLVEGYAALQKEGIANMDIKPKNIILVENPTNTSQFYYKISDFGIANEIQKGEKLINSKFIRGMTEYFVAPEIKKLFDKRKIGIEVEEFYNPFVADVYSLGIVIFLMINENFFKRQENFEKYERLQPILEKMLELDPLKRIDFLELKTLLNQIKISNENEPLNELQFLKMSKKNIEKKLIQKIEEAEKLYIQHKKLYQIYLKELGLMKLSKKHLKKAFDILTNLKDNNKSNLEITSKIDVDKEEIDCLNYFGSLYRKIGNLEKSRKFMLKSLDKSNRKYGPNNEHCNVKIFKNFGLFLDKAEEFYSHSLIIYQNIYGGSHPHSMICSQKLKDLQEKKRNENTLIDQLQNWGKYIDTKENYLDENTITNEIFPKTMKSDFTREEEGQIIETISGESKTLITDEQSQKLKSQEKMEIAKKKILNEKDFNTAFENQIHICLNNGNNVYFRPDQLESLFENVKQGTIINIDENSLKIIEKYFLDFYELETKTFIKKLMKETALKINDINVFKAAIEKSLVADKFKEYDNKLAFPNSQYFHQVLESEVADLVEKFKNNKNSDELKSDMAKLKLLVEHFPSLKTNYEECLEHFSNIWVKTRSTTENCFTIYSYLEEEILKNKKFDLKNLPEFNYSDIVLLENLGEGGFGCVKKVYHKRMETYVAIKQFKNSEVSMKELQLEHYLFSIVEELSKKKNNHMYFLKYYGSFWDRKSPNSIILMMEDGKCSLGDILRAGKVYSCSEIFYVLKNLINAFALLEEKGIAHRDIKPDNIILVPKEKDPNHFYYKLSDFGIGCHLKKNENKISINNLLGFSKVYAAPEILDEESYYNPFKSDVYSLAKTVLKMMGRKEQNMFIDYKNSSLDQIDFNIKKYSSLFQILIEMLEIDPEKRCDFKHLMNIIKATKKSKIMKSKEPEDEIKFIEIWEKEKENPKGKTIQALEKIYHEHQALYEAYSENVSRLNKAKSHLEKAMEILEILTEKNLNTEDINLKIDVKEEEIIAKNQMGDLCFRLGDFTKAEDYYNKAKQKSGDHNENQFYFIDIFNGFAHLYHNKGNLHKAKEFYSKALNISLNIFGENFSKTAVTENNLGGLYKDMGNLKKSFEFYEKSLKNYLNLFGENHSNVAALYNNLGILSFDMGDLLKSKELYEKALKIYIDLFGENHINVASAYNNMGVLYKNIGNFQKAEEFYQKALTIGINLFGEDHFNLTKIFTSLGDLYKNMGNLSRAEEYYKKTLTINLRLGEDHPNVANCYNNLGSLNKVLANLSLAEEYYKKALKIYLTCFGHNHVDVAGSYDNLGNLFLLMGNLRESEEFYLTSLKIRLNLFGENQKEVGDSYINLGALYFSLKDLPKAEGYYKKGLELFLKLFNEFHPKVASCYNNLGNLFCELENLSNAQEFQYKALKIYMKIYGENHSDVAMAYNNLGNSSIKMGNFKEAEEFYQRSLKIYVTLYGEKHQNTIKCYYNLSSVCRTLNQIKKARNMSAKAYKLSSQLYGENHFLTKTCLTLVNELKDKK